MRLDISNLARLFKDVTQVTANRMRKGDVRDDALAKEGGFASTSARAIEKLIRDHHVERSILFLQRTNGGCRKYSLDSQHFHGIDVGAIRNFSGRKTVATPVSRQKGDGFAFKRTDDEAVRRFPK